MALTKSNFPGTTYGAASSAPSPVFTGPPALTAKPGVPPYSSGSGAMEERRLGSRKISMSAVLDGSESAQDRTITFYAAKAILDSECRGVNFDVRLRALGRIMCQDFIAGQTITEFNKMYDDQLETPSRFTVLSYHDRTVCLPSTYNLFLRFPCLLL